MKGFCVQLKRMVEMSEIETIRMPDLSFIHRGKFTDKSGVTHTVIRRVYPHETIMTDSGHHYPREVHIGASTPAKIYRDPVGQKIVIEDKHIETAKEDGSLKSHDELMEEVKANVKDIIEKGAGGAGDFFADLLAGKKLR